MQWGIRKKLKISPGFDPKYLLKAHYHVLYRIQVLPWRKVTNLIPISMFQKRAHNIMLLYYVAIEPLPHLVLDTDASDNQDSDRN